MTARPLTALLVVAACLLCLPQCAFADRAVDVRATVRLLNGGGSSLLQAGSFSGAPFGRGTVRVRTSLGRGSGALVQFTLVNGRGSLSGRGDCTVTFRGTQVVYAGSATITSASGAYRGTTGRLRFGGRGDVAGSSFTVALTGRVSG